MENQTEENKDKLIESRQEQESTEKAFTVNEDKLNAYMEHLKLEQNLPFAILGGSVAAIVGGILWALLTISTGYQIGYMALAIGFMVGFAVKLSGKGIDKIFGITGAALALIGCLIGNYLSVVGIFANEYGIGLWEALSMVETAAIPGIMVDTFQFMDVIFYGIAIYEGYQFSFRKITEEDIIQNAVN